ncbi:MAG: pilus assembly protein [Planctomycetales bacterium]|nr:pilus assembly protein [Planctomycetales bacterium]NIP69231.1 pilus assembly protein [Planctomycetales bacterium]
MRTTASKRRARRGAEVLELAIVLLLFMLINLSIFEFGRMMMVQEIITNGAREGARRGVPIGATNAQALTVIDDYLTAAGISGYTRTITPSVDSTGRGETFTVRVTVPFTAIDWGVMMWLSDNTLVAEVEMRKE